MADYKKVHYGRGQDEYVVVNSLADELKFVEVMKLYKTCNTLEDLENALTEEAKEAIRLID
jgi:uncharacterized protein (DUF433 family)